MRHKITLHKYDIRRFPDSTRECGFDELLAHATDKQKILGFQVHDDRLRVLAAQIMLRKFIGGSVRREDANGMLVKPHSGGGSPYFNVSHDSDWVIVGVSDLLSVGVDVMKVQLTNPRVSLEKMFSNLHNIMSATEWGYIMADRDTHKQLTRFYHLWTAKEAYVKCIGTGLYTEPHLLETRIVRTDKDSILMSMHEVGRVDRANRFTIKVHDNVIENYIVAVCVGPVGLCDPSWTGDRVIQEPQDPINPPLIELVVHDVSYIDLVS